MAQARLSMLKVREILRLKFELGLTERQILTAVGASRSAVQDCVRRCRHAEIGRPLPAGVDDTALMARLYRREPSAPTLALPDFAHVHRELARPGVTRDLRWREYKTAQPDGAAIHRLLQPLSSLVRDSRSRLS